MKHRTITAIILLNLFQKAVRCSPFRHYLKFPILMSVEGEDEYLDDIIFPVAFAIFDSYGSKLFFHLMDFDFNVSGGVLC